jgi:hypothetical protein
MLKPSWVGLKQGRCCQMQRAVHGLATAAVTSVQRATSPAKLVIGVFMVPNWSLASACSTHVVGVILQSSHQASCQAVPPKYVCCGLCTFPHDLPVCPLPVDRQGRVGNHKSVERLQHKTALIRVVHQAELRSHPHQPTM